jgi:predicted GIY-YIG superfamily endonuclease
MHYVYILQSIKNPERFYTGSTGDLKKRINEHNSGYSSHTNKHRLWQLRTYIAFDDKERAEDFEDYLKTRSGRAFMRKRL